MSLSRKILTVGAGTALAQIITAASTPLLTRVFSPEAHAGWAVFLSISVVFSGVAAMRYDLAIVLPNDRRQAAGIVLGGLLSATLVSLFASLVLFLSGNHMFTLELHGSLGLWYWLVPISIFSIAFYQLALAWYAREAAFKIYSLAQFGLPVGILSAQLLFAYGGHRDAFGLIGGTVSGQLMAAGILGFMLWRKDRVVFVSVANISSIRNATSFYRQYPLYMAPYTLVGLARERLAYFLLGKVGPPQTVGYYGLVARLVNLPNSFISSAIRPVFFQYAADSDLRKLEAPMLRTIWTLGMVSVLFWAPCIVQAKWLFGFVFGAPWEAAAPYAIAMSFPAIPLLMGNWADRTFDVLGRQRAALFMEIGFSLLAMSGLVLGYILFRDLLLAVVVQSALLTLYYFGWMGMLFHIAGFNLAKFIRKIVEVLLLGGVAWASCRLAAVILPPLVAFGATFILAGAIATILGLNSWRQIRGKTGY